MFKMFKTLQIHTFPPHILHTCAYEDIDTGDMFELNDVCDQATFADCTGCPMAMCVYHKFRSSGIWQLVGVSLVMFWCISFFRR